VLEELTRRMARYQVEATTELERLAAQKAATPEKEESASPGRERRARYEERRLREASQPRPMLLEWLEVGQAMLENRPAEARRRLENMAAADFPGTDLNQRVACALAELGEDETAQELLEKALDGDGENPVVHGRLADIHFKAGRFQPAITAATESLSLLYFQPGIHALLGRALMETGQLDAADQELRVAVAQSPRNLAAHEALARLYRLHLNRPEEAFAHEGRARSLRNEIEERRRVNDAVAAVAETKLSQAVPDESVTRVSTVEAPPAFDPAVAPGQIITVVSGLPRSGTSLMMQLLVAAGREALTDARRIPDEDNPLGYYEFEKTLKLAKDVSWIPEARGKVVKIIAQLLPFLPRNEHYHVVLMERELGEVIASQKAMLARQGRQGAALDERQLSETYRAQLLRVRQQLAHRPETRTLSVNYSELLADPASGAERLACFLGRPFDCIAAAAAVRPELRRQKH
jgi:tetratricopeptide (TPR) repeat protein